MRKFVVEGLEGRECRDYNGEAEDLEMGIRRILKMIFVRSLVKYLYMFSLTNRILFAEFRN